MDGEISCSVYPSIIMREKGVWRNKYLQNEKSRMLDIIIQIKYIKVVYWVSWAENSS